MGEECTITLGERRYAVERGFGALPKSMSLGLPSQVAVDSQSRVHLYQRNGPPVLMFDADDRVLVADRENHLIQLFTMDGDLLHVWQGFVNPMDIWVDQAGLVYVTDQVPSLHLISPAGERLGRARPSLNGAHGIFGAPDGTLYLAEMRPHMLTRLRPLA
jgi:hypothetical protein